VADALLAARQDIQHADAGRIAEDLENVGQRPNGIGLKEGRAFHLIYEQLFIY
jgi:hypothetical protein